MSQEEYTLPNLDENVEKDVDPSNNLSAGSAEASIAVEEDFDPHFERRKDKLDIFLTAMVAVLVLALLGFVGFFTWRVVVDRRIAAESSAQYRIIEQIKLELKESPNSVPLRVRLGEAYMLAGDYKEAAKQFQEALKLQKDHVGAYYNLGMAFLYMEQDKDAEKSFQKVIELTEGTQYQNMNSNREAAFYAMGRIYLGQKQYEKAAGYFKESQRINSAASDTYVGLALCLIGMKDYQGAIDQLEMGRQFDPSNSEINYLLGEAYTGLDDKVNAVYYYAAAFEKNPDQPEIKKAIESYGDVEQYITKAEQALAANDLEVARDNVIIATNLDLNDADTVKLHIAIADKMKKYDECLQIAKTAQDKFPDDGEFKSLVKKYTKLAPKEGTSN